jgi:hypothetical protein
MEIRPPAPATAVLDAAELVIPLRKNWSADHVRPVELSTKVVATPALTRSSDCRPLVEVPGLVMATEVGASDGTEVGAMVGCAEGASAMVGTAVVGLEVVGAAVGVLVVGVKDGAGVGAGVGVEHDEALASSS